MNVIQLTFSVKCTLCVHTIIMSTSYDTVGTSHCNNNVVISVDVGEYQQCVHPSPIALKQYTAFLWIWYIAILATSCITKSIF